MTKKEAKERAEVLLAFVEGKDIEYRLKGSKPWITRHQICKDSFMSFNFEDYEYRIKKEPEFHPFENKEECYEEMLKHQPFGWVKYNGWLINLINIDNVGVDFLYEGDYDSLNYVEAAKRLTFIDEAPFVKKE